MNKCIFKGGGGVVRGHQALGNPLFFKKMEACEIFKYVFYFFGRAPLISKTMSLLPRFPKTITSAPQLLEKE